MNVIERFLRYVSFDTQSAEDSDTVPTTAKQKLLGAALAQELTEIGLHGAKMDEYGYVYGWLPATAGCEGIPCVGLIAHMDTSPDAPGDGVKPQIIHYEGGDIPLSERVIMREADFESLKKYVGRDLIVTDGTTLLGADDKAGVAEILTAMEYLVNHPELPHGRIAVGITPDEEVGSGADHFDVEGFGAAAAYTVDGGELGELEYENFNAASARVTIRGFNIHPGSAKNKMKNACLIAMEFAGMLPPAETPAHTEGYEGFYHLNRMEGDETETRLSFLLRDHDRVRFEARKERMNLIAAYLNEKYGPPPCRWSSRTPTITCGNRSSPICISSTGPGRPSRRPVWRRWRFPSGAGPTGRGSPTWAFLAPTSPRAAPTSTALWSIFPCMPWRRWWKSWSTW